MSSFANSKLFPLLPLLLEMATLVMTGPSHHLSVQLLWYLDKPRFFSLESSAFSAFILQLLILQMRGQLKLDNDDTQFGNK